MAKPQILHRYLLFLLGIINVMAACDRPQPVSGTPSMLPPPEVTIATPLKKEVTDLDEYMGRLVAVKSVDVHARVRGYLESIHFKEGAIVNSGDLLYIIDPRPYQAALDQARANLARAIATLDLATSDLARAERLFKTHTISQEGYDSRNNQKREAAAAVDAVKAAVKVADLDLEFTRIKSPITGLIGKTLLTEGNLVKGGDMESTLLTTIVSLDPIYLYLTADEQTLLRYLRTSDNDFRQNLSGKGHPVKVRLADEKEYTREGYINFMDNQIDPSTGTLEVRAVIPNSDLFLLPGMFAYIQIPGDRPYSALLIPDAAINLDQTLQYVYVIDKDNVAERREVITGRKAYGLRVIQAGLEDSDRVIINGIQRVRPGNKVNPRDGVIEEQPGPALTTAAP
ncbi:MAG: efflux RND transporter periplasmic adaptor subunit [Gammaproteobacteria bacterium]